MWILGLFFVQYSFLKPFCCDVLTLWLYIHFFGGLFCIVLLCRFVSVLYTLAGLLFKHPIMLLEYITNVKLRSSFCGWGMQGACREGSIETLILLGAVPALVSNILKLHFNTWNVSCLCKCSIKYCCSSLIGYCDEVLQIN